MARALVSLVIYDETGSAIGIPSGESCHPCIFLKYIFIRKIDRVEIVRSC